MLRRDRWREECRRLSGGDDDRLLRTRARGWPTGTLSRSRSRPCCCFCRIFSAFFFSFWIFMSLCQSSSRWIHPMGDLPKWLASSP